jgi:hypothetical protein
MKFTLPLPKPRNPYVMASRGRAAGAHRTGMGARRQRDARELRREIERLRPSP